MLLDLLAVRPIISVANCYNATLLNTFQTWLLACEAARQWKYVNCNIHRSDAQSHIDLLLFDHTMSQTQSDLNTPAAVTHS